MSASICIQSGISAGASYWIDRPVVRIGSDPQCDICLPTAELAPHALTLEFRDGGYRAHNRGTATVTVGGAAVPPGASEIWGGDQTLQLPGDLRLLLEIDGDPRPSPRPEVWTDNGHPAEAPSARSDAAAGPAPAAATAKKSSSTLVPVAIIGVCLLGILALLTMRGGGGETNSPKRPTFDAVVEASLASQGAARSLLPRLQYAQAALVRGHNRLARERFAKLRDQLVRLNDSPSAEDREDLQRMLDYVEYRLGTIKTK